MCKNYDENQIMGITKISRRIEELKSFDMNTIGGIDGESYVKVKALRIKINDTIADIFGRDTAEYKNYEIYSLDNFKHVEGKRYTLREVRRATRKGIDNAVIELESCKETLQEKLKDKSINKPESKVTTAGTEQDATSDKKKRWLNVIYSFYEVTVKGFFSALFDRTGS